MYINTFTYRIKTIIKVVLFFLPILCISSCFSTTPNYIASLSMYDLIMSQRFDIEISRKCNKKFALGLSANIYDNELYHDESLIIGLHGIYKFGEKDVFDTGVSLVPNFEVFWDTGWNTNKNYINCGVDVTVRYTKYFEQDFFIQFNLGLFAKTNDFDKYYIFQPKLDFRIGVGL